MILQRRVLMRALGATVLSAIAAPTWAAIGEQQTRSLALDNIHTGEKLRVDYWQNGVYVPEALAGVNHVLRDYRNNEIHAIAPNLLDLLVVLHKTLDSTEPFNVISGYRSPATNAMLREASHGVAAHSLHMQGMAIDIRLPDKALETVHEAALSLRCGGVGCYPKPDFVHVDVGRVRRW